MQSKSNNISRSPPLLPTRLADRNLATLGLLCFFLSAEQSRACDIKGLQN
uniref:Uncharacterized protein n=1 Tax=Rhizophora mucronata TaxID=61149 RepID=A0A2P2PXR6_RHIMU